MFYIRKIIVFCVFVIGLIIGLCGCVKEPKPLPKADFSYEINTPSCEVPMEVVFINNSKNAQIYYWDFGDGSPISHEESPIHTYQNEGIYTVHLTAYGTGGTSEEISLIYAVGAPVSSFYTQTTTVEVGDTVHFFSTTSSTLPATLLWSFGDGFTSIDSMPSHIYSYPGTYTVVLTSTNACGSSYVVMTDYIVVNMPGTKPTPDFMADQTIINSGSAINFTDLSVNNPQSWEWTFDGGFPNIVNSQHPQGIFYNSPGTYNVTLKTSNAYGDSTLTKIAYIQVIPQGVAPVADFIASNTVVTTGTAVQFTDLSVNSPTIWQWDFPGATPSTSTVQHPTNIIYNTPGVYNVTLTVTNAMGSDTKTKQAYIVVNPNTATQVNIKKITVESMPFPSSQPNFRNPYYRITNMSNTVLKDGRNEYKPSIFQNNLPIFWDISPYFTISNFNTSYKIRLFDWRPNPNMDSFVSEVVFTMSNYTSPPNAFPNTITLQQNQTKIILDLEWQ